MAAKVSKRCSRARREERSRLEAQLRYVPEEGDEGAQTSQSSPLLMLGAADQSALATRPLPPVGDRQLERCCRFTDAYPLASYAGLVRYTPRLVNVVTLSDVLPVEGSGTTLPLDLAHIATHCTGAYFAPRRFAAVQLATHKRPRARVLVFRTPSPLERARLRRYFLMVASPASADTGRIVGTGTTGAVSARLAVMQAVSRLAKEANIHLRVTSFEVKNAVGAVTLGATVNCEEFAQTHTDTVHYDRSSFVGMVRATLYGTLTPTPYC